MSQNQKQLLAAARKQFPDEEIQSREKIRTGDLQTDLEESGHLLSSLYLWSAERADFARAGVSCSDLRSDAGCQGHVASRAFPEEIITVLLMS